MKSQFELAASFKKVALLIASFVTLFFVSAHAQVNDTTNKQMKPTQTQPTTPNTQQNQYPPPANNNLNNKSMPMDTSSHKTPNTTTPKTNTSKQSMSPADMKKIVGSDKKSGKDASGHDLYMDSNGRKYYVSDDGTKVYVK